MSKPASPQRMRMALLCLGAALLVCVGLAAPPARSAGQRRGPFVLVTLPSLGTVSWSCGGPSDGEVALAFRVSQMDATTLIRFAAAGVKRAVTLQPGESTRFPFFAPGRQQLTVEQGTEARTLHAIVVATFSRGQSYCFRYFPPRITARVWQAR